MINDDIQAKGELGVVLKKADGSVKEEHKFKNIVVISGKEFIARRMTDDTEPFMTHMSVGNSNVNLEIGNTALESEIGRVAIDSTTVADNVVTYTAEFAAGVGTGAIVETGIFNNQTPDIMLCRTTFPVINKEQNDILTINWAVTIN